jgi:ubiquinone/menaquinone biosynthesis C-methylase UbiE
MVDAGNKMTAEEAIINSINVPGKRVLDVGCGEGEITRALALAGSYVIGLDPNPAQIQYVLTNEPDTGEIYVQASGQELPFICESFDSVVYNNALHLVPGDLQRQALEEAVRVLKPGGFLYIANPLAEGASHELKKAIGDEVYAQPNLTKAIVSIKQELCTEEKEFVYAKMLVLKDFESYRDRAIRRGPYRQKLFAQNEQKVQELFSSICPKVEGGFAISQFIHVNLLVKN